MGPTRTSTGPRIIRRHPRILHRKECCSHRHRRGTHQRQYSHHPSQCRKDVRHHRHRPGSSKAGRRWGRRRDPRARKVHRCALHVSTMRSRGFARSLRVCLWMRAPWSPRSARSTRFLFGASRIASRGGLHVSRVFRVLQHPIKTEPEEESTAPMDPPQEPEAAKEESARAPEEQCGNGRGAPGGSQSGGRGNGGEGRDSANLVNRADLSWSSPGSIFSNTQEGDEWPDPDEVRGRQNSQPLFFSRPVPLAQQAHSQPTPQWWHR